MTGMLARIPFTITLMVSLAGLGVLSRTHAREISDAWLKRFGFAPADLWVFKIEKLFLSALMTDGKKAFCLALLMVGVSSGILEFLRGSVYAAAVFWGVHTVTLIVVSLVIVLPMHRLKIASGEALSTAKDVGPSAGYFGSLGALIMQGKSPWSFALSGTITAALVALSFLPPGPGQNALVKKHSDLAHMIAMVLGILSALWFR